MKELKMIPGEWIKHILKLRAKNAYLYRAVDSQGNAIAFFVSDHRDKDAAKKFFKKALKATHNQQPRVTQLISTLQPKLPSMK